MSIIDGGLTREPFIYLQGGTVRGSYPLHRCRPQVRLSTSETLHSVSRHPRCYMTCHRKSLNRTQFTPTRTALCGHDNVIRNLHPGLESFSSPPLAKANRRSHLGAFRAHLSGLPE